MASKCSQQSGSTGVLQHPFLLHAIWYPFVASIFQVDFQVDSTAIRSVLQRTQVMGSGWSVAALQNAGNHGGFMCVQAAVTATSSLKQKSVGMAGP